MADDTENRTMLVLADTPQGADAVLSIGARYATATETFVPRSVDQGTAPSPVAAGQGLSTQVSQAIDELLGRAADQEIPWVGIRRDLAPPADLLRELLVATGRHSSTTMPGFAVFLAEGEVEPFTRILAIVDRRHGPTSGLLAHTAVSVAEASGAALDVLVIAAHGEDLNVEDETETLAINRERELYDRAVQRAQAARLDVRWLTAAGVADTWTLVSNQLTQHHYSLIIDDLGDVSLGGALRRGAALTQALGPGQVGEIPLRLLSEYFNPVLLVVDGIRLGMASTTMLKAGAVAALAAGVVTSGLLPGMATPASSAAQTSGAKPADAMRHELERALDTEAQRRSREAAASSRSSERTSKKASRKKTSVTVSGTDPSDVARARAELVKTRKQLIKAKKKLAKAKKQLAAATEDRLDARWDAAAALSKLEVAQAEHDRLQVQASLLRQDASGITGVMPGGTSPEEAADSTVAAEDAGAAVTDAVEAGEEALADLDQAREAVAEATEAVAAASERVTTVTTAVEEDRAVYVATRAALADSRQSPIAKGQYRLTARFGQAGGYWSSGHHTGLDFAGPVGTRISAAASGTVTKAGYEGAYGNRVEIDHGNGYVTTYNHMSSLSVHVGEKVSTGDKVGERGSTGNSTGPHLHFEVIRNGTFVDPEAWLGW